MRKIALVIVLAVLVPSLALAWLAMHSLRDQQFLLERQQALLAQAQTDAVVQRIGNALAQQQQEFSAQVEELARLGEPREVAAKFDAQLTTRWPFAEVGFCVTDAGLILAPPPHGRSVAQMFRLDNASFLGNHEPEEVYWNANSLSVPQAVNQGAALKSNTSSALAQNGVVAQNRLVSPQSSNAFRLLAQTMPPVTQNNFSKVLPAQAEFSQLASGSTDGVVARFLQNCLKLLCWHRLARAPGLIFGAQLNLARVVEALRPLVQPDESLRGQIGLAILDDRARPVASSPAGLQTDWKRPLVASEIGEALPHWEVAAYLLDPAALTSSARMVERTLGILVGALVLAIGLGSWSLIRSLNAELKLAREQTDFVSNVSHELKTPLTSIRMFSELLHEGRVSDPAQQQSYLAIIATEAARLTRLINHVLDFAGRQSGEEKAPHRPCDLAAIAREAIAPLQPALEANGFTFTSRGLDEAQPVLGEADALTQVIVNLLSNAEKYSRDRREIELVFTRENAPQPCVELSVRDRGLGVPRGSGERIFEKFTRAHDSLSSGISGSGLGLTIARQIARAHGGELRYEPRPGGGSVFTLSLPLQSPGNDVA